MKGLAKLIFSTLLTAVIFQQVILSSQHVFAQDEAADAAPDDHEVIQPSSGGDGGEGSSPLLDESGTAPAAAVVPDEGSGDMEEGAGVGEEVLSE